jgi:hypothetical protein
MRAEMRAEMRARAEIRAEIRGEGARGRVGGKTRDEGAGRGGACYLLP